MRTGKLPPALLASLLSRIPHTDPRVLVSSGIGEDAAALDFLSGGAAAGGDDRILVAKTDPITFATDLIGWYAVHVNANDVACMGAEPRWFLATALLPESWDEARIAALFDQLVEACAGIGASLVGGHTEVTGGLDRPVVVGCMLGEVQRSRLVRTAGAQPGDSLILTQGIAIEGTAVLAREAESVLRRRGVEAGAITRAQQMLFDPGISVVPAARALCAAAPPPDGVHSLHDPTEGGLAGGLWEVLEASRVGARIDAASIRVLPETQTVCGALDLDPFGLLASGSLLAAVSPEATPAALGALRRMGVPSQAIGTVTPRDAGIVLVDERGNTRPWPTFDRDEVARYFDVLSQRGG